MIALYYAPRTRAVRVRWLLEELVERALEGHDYLADRFSAADVMLGFTLGAVRVLGVLDARYANINAYQARLEARPAFQRATAD